MFFLKKIKKMFSFSSAIILLFLALLIVFFGITLTVKAFQNKDGTSEWDSIETRNPTGLDTFLNNKKKSAL